MVGILSFLAVASAIAFVVAVLLLVVRSVKKQPRKPFAAMAAASAVAFCVLAVWVSSIYEPAPKPADAVAESEPDASAAGSESASETGQTASVDEPVPEETPAPSSAPAGTEKPAETEKPEQSAAPDESSAPSSAPVETKKPEQSAAPAESSTEETEPSSAPDVSALSLAETYKTDVVVASKMLLDRFITDYSVYLAPQLWTVADFDSEGAVIALADVTFKSSGAVERALLVLTPVIENGKMTEATPHYVAVGETVYGDDGYCDDVFSNLQEAFDAFAAGGSQ